MEPEANRTPFLLLRKSLMTFLLFLVMQNTS